MAVSSSQPLHIVVNIFSPVKIALQPLMKQRNCSCSFMVYLPAAKRIIDLGMIKRAVAIVFKISSNFNFFGELLGNAEISSSMGVPLIGTNALIGRDSGCNSIVANVWRKATWSSSVSPKPRMPPVQALIPAFWTFLMVFNRSS